MSESESTSQQATELTVALDMPSARVLADQASVVQDLQYVMDCCRRLLAVLSSPEEGRDEIVPLALWSSAVVAYGRCFGADGKSGLTVEDVRGLPLEGEVFHFHQWIIGERDLLTGHPADPFEAAKIGAALAPAALKLRRRVQGIAVFATSRVLIDATGVRQLGGLASELAKRIAGRAQTQQDSVLSDAQKLNIDTLYAAPPLQTQPS
ncbi:MAG TPA: hypothetical protein VGD91_29910 [Trebonia sp.]